MELAHNDAPATWRATWMQQAQTHPTTALGLALALATVVLLLAASVWRVAGAMIFVGSHEVIPDTHRNGHQTPATIGLMAGFAVMMVLDTTLG